MSTPCEVKERRAALLESRALDRRRLISRLEDEGADRHAERLEKCGTPIQLRCSCCDAQRTAHARCDLKHCPSCAPRLAHDKTAKYEGVVATFKSPLWVTFTTRNFSARSKTETGMRAVIRAFKRLRAQRWWKRSVLGGVAAFEMTRRNKGWHPHVHALLDSRWFAATITAAPQGSTSEQWRYRARLAVEEVAEQWTLAMSGRRSSIKVRRVSVKPGQTIRDALRETLKYSATAESLLNMTGKSLSLFLDELAVTRNLVAFGSAYRHPAVKKKPRDPSPCDSCGEFQTMVPLAVAEARDRAMGKKPFKRTHVLGR